MCKCGMIQNSSYFEVIPRIKCWVMWRPWEPLCVIHALDVMISAPSFSSNASRSNWKIENMNMAILFSDQI